MIKPPKLNKGDKVAAILYPGEGLVLFLAGLRLVKNSWKKRLV
jgi:hypothetical protein